MVKKTLLSLAVATALTSMVGCNVSTTDRHENKIKNEGITYAQQSDFYPIFAPEIGELPLASDFVFADAGASDGTANTADTTPPVTTALNKLDGFSTIAPHYIEFSSDIDPSTVTAGKTVLLIKLANAKDIPGAGIDGLDIDTILAATNGAPFSTNGISADSYEANVVGLNDGRTPAIQILLKEPLEAKTKYIITLTDGIKSISGESIGHSATYSHAIGKDKLMNPDLAPVRKAVQGWEQVANGFLGQVAKSSAKSAFSYAFTTGGTTDVLNAMAAPATFATLQAGVAEQITSIEAGEGVISQAVIEEAMEQGAPEAMAEQLAEDQLDAIAGLVADAIEENAPGTLPTTDGATVRPILKAQAGLQQFYLSGLIQAATKGKGDAVAAAVDAPKERQYEAILEAPNQAFAVSYDTFFEQQVKPLVVEGVEALITNIEEGESVISQAVIEEAMEQGAPEAMAEQLAEDQLDAIAGLVADAIEENAPGTLPTTDGATVRPILKAQAGLQQFYLDGLQQAAITSKLDEQVAELSSHGAIYQGGLKVPSYLADAEAGDEDAGLGTWTANDAAAQALGLPAAPRDCDGIPNDEGKTCTDIDPQNSNVTYRFPFANKIGDNTIPVMVTLPEHGSTATECQKPDDGWPVAIYQHGITVDRTAGVLVGNALATFPVCTAMVAIDHVMHGVAPGNATDLVFSVDTIAKGAVDATGSPTADVVKSPFAVARAGAAMQGDTFMAELKERHNNVGKDDDLDNVAMQFESAGAEADVGASGDLYINLQNFARTRDAMRQTVMDMLNLSASLKAMDVDGSGDLRVDPETGKVTNPDLDPSKVYFIGHSLGSIVGTTFVAVNNDPQVQAFNGNLPKIQAAILGNGGGGVVKLLENSPMIGGAKILPGLEAAAGLTQGSADIEKFFGVMQAMVDSADPINFASSLGLQNTPVLAYTAVGDVVVPNNANNDDVVIATAKSYLAGTEPLSKLLKLKDVDAGSIEGDKGFVKGKRLDVRIAETKGDHSTFSNAEPRETFTEIYKQIGSFLLGAPAPLNKGPLEGVVVQDKNVLEQAE